MRCVIQKRRPIISTPLITAASKMPILALNPCATMVRFTIASTATKIKMKVPSQMSSFSTVDCDWRRTSSKYEATMVFPVKPVKSPV